MTDSSPQPAPAPAAERERAPVRKPVPFEPEREVRFAVVMYGGVSLAIYINGVAQELLNMVRATAPDKPDGTTALLDNIAAAKGPTAVYRKLGQYLHDPKRLLESKDEPARQTTESIRTRFLVDVISGTSAGGINGVFLAKALAKNQDMKGLRELWLSEGDLGRLLNDPLSVADLRESGFSVQEPRQSLLNSQRMYRKLLEALAQMDKEGSEKPGSVYDGVAREKNSEQEKPAPVPSPLVDELDLFITTTDIEGIPLPIALSDMVVFERRYKNVFHFRHELRTDPPRDDFQARNDPFLAFAARCTSSFPFAFEPMRLCDIDEVTSNYPRYAGARHWATEWDGFYNGYLRHALYDLDKEARGTDPAGKLEHGENAATNELRDAFRTRAFGDGGYLDNKPFSYATSMLMRRHSDYLVDRKMIYVEPSPEHPELMPRRREPPNFAENVRAAVLELPRQETIREDLDALDERNRMIQRVATFAREVDADVGSAENNSKAPEDFANASLGDLMKHYGVSYGAYHRLKVAEITSYLAEFVTRAKGHDPSSDAGTAIRALVAAWRSENYVPSAPPGQTADGVEPKKTENKFLLEFDLRFRLRRIIFLIRRVNELSQLDPKGMGEQAKRLLAASLKHLSGKPGVEELSLKKIRNWMQPPEPPPAGSSPEPVASDEEMAAWLGGFAEEMRQLKKDHLAPALAQARSVEERFLRLGSSKAHSEEPVVTVKEGEKIYPPPLGVALKHLDIQWSDMKKILDAQGLRRAECAKEILAEDPKKALQTVADAIRNELAKEKFIDLGRALERAETPSSAKPGSDGADSYVAQGRLAARLCLRKYDEDFLNYDMVIYPLQYGTGAAEANVVEVFRISPEDATSLIGERRPGESRRKLAGTALMSFGAFLDRGWRKNDMLWGRLDGAERLITALWPPNADKTIRDGLIKDAQMAILEEEVKSGDLDAIKRLLSNALARFRPSSRGDDGHLREVVEELVKKELPDPMGLALRESLADPAGIWSYYKESFEVNRNLEPENALRLISRATTVTGKMLEGLADKYGSDRGQRTAVWIARLGSVFWNLVAVAVPGSLGNLFVRHWLAVLYIFSVTMILGGIFVNASVKPFGWQALGLTAALNLVIFLLGDFMAGRWRWLRILGGVAITGFVALIACGVLYATNLLGRPIQRYEPEIVVGVVAILVGVLSALEVRRHIRSFLDAPDAAINYRALWWLTGITAFLGGVLFLLARSGQNNIVELEFARDLSQANRLVAQAGAAASFHRQLLVDYLFLISYAATFAAYCGAAARLFWQRYVIIARKAHKNHAAESKKAAESAAAAGKPAPATVPWQPSRWLRTLRWFALAGFAFAALQFLAGLADAAENTGLLVFLHPIDPSAKLTAADVQKIMQAKATGVTIAFYCAALKFALIALGMLYSAAGFVVGCWHNRKHIQLRVFAAISLLIAYVSAGALFRNAFWRV